RTVRQRAERRLEKGIEDLSRLLATDAQAGAVLGQRINAMTQLNAGSRLEAVEADISVLGTVIRQVAEAVADVEQRQAKSQAARPERALAAPPVPQRPVPEVEPRISIAALQQAIDDNRLIYHVQPIVTLPQRRPHGYDLLPRLQLGNGQFVNGADFMPRHGGEEALRHIEGIALVEAITMARRARAGGQMLTLYIPLSRATLGDISAAEQLLASVEANPAIAPGMMFVISEADWFRLSPSERAMVGALASNGAGFSLGNVTSLRLEVAELAGQGVKSLRIDSTNFIAEPESFTDFHAADIANYLARFDVKLLATGVTSERQIIELLEDGIPLASGEHIAAAGPVRADQLLQPAGAAVRPRLRRVDL
ncbi:MAG TPA: EAL domain-containing protein, partial [Devosia sp.]|nr:EAL domain-containing protein [Devosia sp.]